MGKGLIFSVLCLDYPITRVHHEKSWRPSPSDQSSLIYLLQSCSVALELLQIMCILEHNRSTWHMLLLNVVSELMSMWTLKSVICIRSFQCKKKEKPKKWLIKMFPTLPSFSICVYSISEDPWVMSFFLVKETELSSTCLCPCCLSHSSTDPKEEHECIVFQLHMTL